MACVPTGDGLKMGSTFMERILTIHKNNQRIQGIKELFLKGKTICIEIDKRLSVCYVFVM